MSLTRIHTFTNTTLDAADLNGEFDNIVYKFGNLTIGDTDLGASTPYEYIVASTSTPINDQVPAAIAAGKYLYLPEGGYTMDPDTLPQGTRIVGAGMDLVNIIGSNLGSSTYLMRFGYTEEPLDVYISDVTFTLPNSGGAVNIAVVDIGSTSTDVAQFTIERVRMQSYLATTKYFFRVGSVDGRLNIQDCFFEGFSYAIVAPPSLYLTVKRCVFLDTRVGVFSTSTVGTSTDGMWEIRNCLFMIDDAHSSDTYYNIIGGPARFVGNQYVVTDGSGLTAINRIEHAGNAPTAFEFEHLDLPTTSSPTYWYSIYGNNATVQFCYHEGRMINAARNIIQLGGDTNASTDLNTRFGSWLNIHPEVGVYKPYTPVTTADERRKLAPVFGKECARTVGENRALPFQMEDVYVTIESYSTGADVNKLVFTKISENQQDLVSLHLPITGTTSLLT